LATNETINLYALATNETINLYALATNETINLYALATNEQLTFGVPVFGRQAGSGAIAKNSRRPT
jgi:hypothetical protein